MKRGKKISYEKEEVKDVEDVAVAQWPTTDEIWSGGEEY